MKLLTTLLLTFALSAAHAQHSGHNHDSHPSKQNSPSGDVRSLDVYAANGKLHLLVALYDPSVDGSKLYYQQSNGDPHDWSAPIRIDEGAPVPYARGRGTDFHIAAWKDTLVAIWMTRGTGFGGRGPLVAAYSKNGGNSWTLSSNNPADDGTDGDHAFIDVTATPSGAFQAVWLDKRSDAGKGVTTSRSTDGGMSWTPNTFVDTLSCQCCWNVIQSDAKGHLYTLYRDINPRDMALGISTDNGQTWTRHSTVGEFNWQIDGCPHAGGGLAIEGSGDTATLHSLVWTGVEKRNGLYYLNTNRKSKKWATPKKFGDWSAKHGDLTIDSDGRLALAWAEPSPDGIGIGYTFSTDSGKTWSPPQHTSSPNEAPSHPRLVTLENKTYLFWTQTTQGKTNWHCNQID